MTRSAPLRLLPLIAFVFCTSTAFADAVCVAGPVACPGFLLSGGTLGPITAVEGVQGSLPGGVFVTAGDVLLVDTGGGGSCTPAAPDACSDILRFFDIGNGTSTFFLLFSDNPGTEPPDVGIPVTIHPVNFTMDEVGGPFYTAGGATYLIASDTTPGTDTPEPGTIWPIGAAWAVYWLSSRTRRRI